MRARARVSSILFMVLLNVYFSGGYFFFFHIYVCVCIVLCIAVTQDEIMEFSDGITIPRYAQYNPMPLKRTHTCARIYLYFYMLSFSAQKRIKTRAVSVVVVFVRYIRFAVVCVCAQLCLLFTGQLTHSSELHAMPSSIIWIVFHEHCNNIHYAYIHKLKHTHHFHCITYSVLSALLSPPPLTFVYSMVNSRLPQLELTVFDVCYVGFTSGMIDLAIGRKHVKL